MDYEPPWVDGHAMRMVWRRDFIIAVAGTMGASSGFIADGLAHGATLSERQIRRILHSEVMSEPTIKKLHELLCQSRGA